MNNIVKKDDTADTIIISCLLFISLWGFGLIPIIVGWLLVPIAIFSVFYAKGKTDYFGKYIISFFVFLFVSSISCLFVRHQSLMDTFRTRDFLNYMLLLVYFFYLVLKPSIASVEKSLLLICIIFFIVYFLEYLVYPIKIVPILAGEMTHRFRIIGQAINSLAFLLCLNKWMLTNKTRYLFYLIPCATVFLALSFRTMIAAILIVSFLMFVKVKKQTLGNILKTGVIVLLFGGIISISPYFDSAIDRMTDAQKDEQTYNNKDYIRWIEFEYYTNQFHKNSFEKITGAGQPGKESLYAKQMQVVKEGKIYNNDTTGWKDWGLLGLSWIIGPVTVCILIYIMCKCIYLSWHFDKQYLYIACWFLFLLLISFNNAEAFREGTFSLYAIMLYMTNQLYKDHKTMNILNKVKKTIQFKNRLQ